MPDLKGTRVYWRPSSAGSASAPKQILKNSGYINVVLQAVQYKAGGNFWQRLFGGKDKVTVSTQLNWEAGSDSKTAAAIQDFRKVSVPSRNALAIGRNIALKVPAVADGLEMQVNISAIQDDNLARTFQLLNSDEFKQPLQLAPVAVGQILTIATLVKKAFTDTDPADMLSATYPGIISEGIVADPVANNRLVEGYIILIVKQDDEDELDFDETTISISGNGLMVDGSPIPNTYMVYNVSFDAWRGRDSSAPWSKKFDQASSKADELIFATPDQRQGIVSAAFDLLKAGNALLDDDDNYITAEKTNLKKAATLDVQTKIASNSGVVPAPGARSLSASVAPLGMTKASEALEFSGEDLHEDVANYASQLADSGMAFGFSVRFDDAAIPSPAARDVEARDLSVADMDALRPYVVSMRQGQWDTSGAFNSTADDVDAIFNQHAEAALAALPADTKLKFVVYAHGGLVSEQSGLAQAQTHINWWKKSADQGIYPLYFVWKTGLGETIAQLLGLSKPAADRGLAVAREFITDPIVAGLARRLGGEAVWSGMKRDAEQAVLENAVGTYVAQQMKLFCDRHPGRVELHAVGHSAGAVFHSHYIPMSTVTGNPYFTTTSFMAPAVRVDTFLDLLTLDDGHSGRMLKPEVGHLGILTMREALEKSDNCAKIYRQSLLYLIFHAFEPKDKTPILGLEESIRGNAALTQILGLGGVPAPNADVVWSTTTASDGPFASQATSHGGFSSDQSSLDSILCRILDVSTLPDDRKFPKSRALSNIWDIWAPPSDLPGFEGETRVAVVPPRPRPKPHGGATPPPTPPAVHGNLRALCVGINQYASPNELSGCVSDAVAWRDLLNGLGFKTTLMTDKQATNAAMTAALKDLVSSSRAGDVIVFQYSGHGTQIPDETGRTVNGQDEAVVPVDFSTQNPNLIMDSDLRAIFDTLPAGVNLTCFMDCCHSGLITREFMAAAHPGSKARRMILTPAEVAAVKRRRPRLAVRSRGLTPDGQLHMRDVTFAACRDTELAFESDGHGEFTRRATAILGQGFSGISNLQFSARVTTAFGTGAQQHPELDCAPAAKAQNLLRPLG